MNRNRREPAALIEIAVNEVSVETKLSSKSTLSKSALNEVSAEYFNRTNFKLKMPLPKL